MNKKKYLLDTNICIFFLQGKYGVKEKIQEAGRKNCYISEITIAELLYGAAYSNSEKHRHDVEILLESLTVVPIYDSLPTYATTKAYLRREGQMIEEFDMLIWSSAVHHGYVM
jgi:tRNA(fMet)-specific endonuclease VapC